MFCNKSALSNGLLLISFIVMIIGVLTKWVITPLVVEDQVYQTLELIEGTKGYEVWLEPPNEIYTKYYFFHVTNPDEILDGNTPNLTEVGPYVYKETRKKQNVIPLGDDELQYGQYITYDFDLERTQSEGCLHPVTGLPCRKSDVLTVINAPLVGVLNIIESLPDFEIQLLPGFTFTIKGFLYDLINQKVLAGDEFKDEVFHEYAVDDILWSGYNPGIMKYFFNILDTLEDTIHSSFNITLDLESYLPPQIQNGTLAYFRDKNATDANSFYKINRGRHDKGKYCMIEELNGKSELPDWWWPNIPVSPTAQRSGIKDTCHTLRGSDGVFFPPFIDKNYPLWLYVPDLCRSVFADYESETEIKGIKAWRFRANLDLINYARPENLCFCPAFRQCAIDSGTGYWDLSNCDKPCLDGTLHASGCLGVPVVLSAPHFYNADTSLEKAINGLKSNIDLHDTYLDVEPTSGITLSAHKRGQINVQLNQITEKYGLELAIPTLANVPNVTFPMFWADETATLDDENADLIKNLMVTPLLLVDIFVYAVGFGLAGLGILVGIFLKIRFSLKSAEPSYVEKVYQQNIISHGNVSFK